MSWRRNASVRDKGKKDGIINSLPDLISTGVFQISVSSYIKNGIIYRHDQPQTCQPLNGQV